MTQYDPTVFVVDDDLAVLKGLRLLIRSAGINVETYLRAQDFLDSYDPARPGCLVLDLRMPGMSGLELQETLLKRRIGIPIIIVTGHGNIPAAMLAMKRGAFGFLEKPFNDQVLLDKIQNAIAEDIQTRQKQADRAAVQHDLQILHRESAN